MQTRFLGFAIRTLVVTVLFLSSGFVFAQSIQYGKITGRILDESGEAIPGVQIEISSTALISGTRTATSAADGNYVFLNLPGGTYKATASLTGFVTMTRENIQISAGSTATVDFGLTMGK